jgi:hypothetical protein
VWSVLTSPRVEHGSAARVDAAEQRAVGPALDPREREPPANDELGCAALATDVDASVTPMSSRRMLT